jgi:hypothetical protein
VLAVQCSGGMRVTPANRQQTAGGTQGEIWAGNEGLRWQSGETRNKPLGPSQMTTSVLALLYTVSTQPTLSATSRAA